MSVTSETPASMHQGRISLLITLERGSKGSISATLNERVKNTFLINTGLDLSHTHQMLPSQSHLTGKRKADDSNPLLNAAAAKRAKKEVCFSKKGRVCI